MATENIIDGRHRFAGIGRLTAQSGAVAGLEKRLAATARVPDGDKPILARNLGALASKLEPANAVVGARSIVEEAGLLGLWQKRKRFIRLPDEPYAGVSSGGEYGSSGATFVQLARAAGSLLAKRHSAANAEAEHANAIRALASGSSFLPTYAPRSGAEQSAKGLMDDYRNTLSTAIAQRTNIRELWAVLRDAPFDLIGLFDPEHESLDVPAHSPQVFPGSLLRPMFDDDVKGAVFHSGSDFPSGWQNPVLEVGLLAIRTTAPLFVLPEDVADSFKPEEANVDGIIHSKARAWLEEHGAGHRDANGFTEAIPQIEYGELGEFGWRSVNITCFRHAGLQVCPNSDGEPTVQLVTWGRPDMVAYTEMHFSQREEESAIAASGGTLSQVSMADVDGSEIIWALHAEPFEWRALKRPSPRVIGLLDFLWQEDLRLEELLEPGWTDLPCAASLLLKGEHQFYPNVIPTDAVAVPIHKGSVGAGLYANLAAGADGERFDQMLLEKTRQTAEAGLRFHEWMVENSRDALARI